MPLFEYQCQRCQSVQEVLVRGNVEPAACACGGELAKLVSAPADMKRVDGFFHRDTFSDKEIGSRGLTKYVNRGDGTYEKAAGSGPSVVSRDQLPIG